MSWTIQNLLSPTLCHVEWTFDKKLNMESMWNGTSALRQVYIHYSEQLRTNMDHIDNVMMILTDFKKKKKQPEFHPGELVMVQVPVLSLLLKKHQKVMDTLPRCRQNTHRERPYHKTISFVFAASLF